MKRTWHRLGAGLALACLGLACERERAAPRPSPRVRLVEKDRFQALYGADGRILRLLFDSDGDRRADAVVLYGPEGQPSQGEIDTDHDGVVDRWEVYDATGKMVRVGRSSGGKGEPESWTELP